MNDVKPADALARCVSTGLNPPAIAGVLFTVIALGSGGVAAFPLSDWLISLTFGSLLPAGYALFLLLQGKISHLYAPDRMSRLNPLGVSTLSCMVGAGILSAGWPSDPFSLMMVAYAVLGSIMCLITIFWKVSLHAAGVWLPVAAAGCLYGTMGLYFIPVALLVSWARIATGAHTVLQVFAGGGVGFVTTWSIVALASNYGIC